MDHADRGSFRRDPHYVGGDVHHLRTDGCWCLGSEAQNPTTLVHLIARDMQRRGRSFYLTELLIKLTANRCSFLEHPSDTSPIAFVV